MDTECNLYRDAIDNGESEGPEQRTKTYYNYPRLNNTWPKRSSIIISNQCFFSIILLDEVAAIPVKKLKSGFWPGICSNFQTSVAPKCLP